MLSKCLSNRTNNIPSILFQSIRRNIESQTNSAECPHKVSTETTDWENARPYEDIPGPSKFELVRGFMPGGAFYKQPVKVFFNILQKKYGDFLILPGIFGKKPILMAFDPNMFREVFRNEGIWPARRNFDSAFYFRNVYKKEYFQGNEGLIMTSGESWGKFRTAVNPILMQPKNVKQYLNKMIPVNKDFIQRIREIRDPKTNEMPGNFVDEINRLTFESVAVIALDQELGLIRRNRDSPEAEALFRSLRDFFDLAYELDIKPSLWKIIKTPKFYKMMRVSETMFQITKKYIEDALERMEKNPHSTEDSSYQKSVVEKLAEKDKLVAIVMAMDMMLAGVDTTTTTLTGILFGIGKNPDKQEKLRQEVLSVLPEKDSVPTVESLKNLPYLRASIKEGIRLFPIGPGTVRSLPKNMVLNGYQVPMNTDVAMGNNIILREEKYFPKAEEFIPERWLRTEEGDAFKADEVNPFVYLPFGFGPRSCAGKRIVDLELELTIMRLVRNFNIEFNYSIENAFDTQFIARPIIPLKFKFTEMEN
ncbi:cytochrome P450 CYP12A2-like [Episyrphus balteatus]|uniref:cytochrome P450 CYP12A2-like n=1 Tax=Episyrphus balteatus TaxID=286459 RepID=UPI0024853115|nr:cytochrome P450 CYP12A2-like [Episyrphus balteatus]